MSNRKFTVTGWDQQHYARVEAFAHQITLLYEAAMQEAARIGANLPFDPTNKRPFSFSDYPQAAQRVNDMMRDLASGIQASVNQGTSLEWEFANLKNDALVDSILPTSALNAAQLNSYRPRNLEALAAFQQRKTDGLGLSDRVSKYAGQFKREVELGLEVGIGQGRSATQLSSDLRGYLNEPEKLFRRVRDRNAGPNRGKLSLSKAAKAYHPGQGVYRSSYKNAQRLARTEINMAYRESDYLRWQGLDFVVGIEVRRSNNPYPCPICPSLAGKYPKDFKFVGWHPNCRCHAISILATPEELKELNRMLLSGEETDGFTSSNAVNEPHQGWNDWVNDNRSRLASGQVLPYFIRDNKAYVTAVPLPAPVPPPAPPAPPASIFADAKQAGFQVTSQSEAYFNTLYNDIIGGFDMVTFDRELTGIMAGVDIDITRKTLFTASDTIFMSYTGRNKANDLFMLERSFTRENGKVVVHHDLFSLPKSVQGGGLSKQVFQSLYKQYQAADVDLLKVHANIDVGGYAWARYNFTFANQADRRMVLSRAVRNLSGKDLQEFKAFYATIEKAPIFPMQAVAKHPLGAKVLLKSNWEGILDLKNPKQVALFEDYLFGR